MCCEKCGESDTIQIEVDPFTKIDLCLHCAIDEGFIGE